MGSTMNLDLGQSALKTIPPERLTWPAGARLRDETYYEDLRTNQ
jgi:hypothetical protein